MNTYILKNLDCLFFTKKNIILVKYLDVIDIFSKKVVIELFKHFFVNNYLINLKLNKKHARIATYL